MKRKELIERKTTFINLMLEKFNLKCTDDQAYNFLSIYHNVNFKQEIEKKSSIKLETFLDDINSYFLNNKKSMIDDFYIEVDERNVFYFSVLSKHEMSSKDQALINNDKKKNPANFSTLNVSSISFSSIDSINTVIDNILKINLSNDDKNFILNFFINSNIFSNHKFLVSLFNYDSPLSCRRIYFKKS